MDEHTLQSQADTSADALPKWITTEMIADTLRTWQPYYSELLTCEDAIGILLGTGNLFRILKGDGHEESQTVLGSGAGQQSRAGT